MSRLRPEAPEQNARRPDAGAAAILPVCPACGGSSWSEHLGKTRLRACARCGTVLNDRSRSRAEEESFYTDGAAAAMRKAGEVASSQFQTLLRALGNQDFPDRSILDIGCGQGAFLAAASEGGWKVGGLEIDPVSAAACRQRGFDVAVGSLFDTPLPPGPWSVITFWDVLDHLEDPVGALRLAMHELAPGGMVVIRGRNAAVHVRLKLLHSGFRPVASALHVPDLAVVHRWGFAAGGWTALLQAAHLDFVRLLPAAPTPGDRYGSLGTRGLAVAVKSLTAFLLEALYRLSLGKAYLFPSALLTARKSE